MSSEAIRLLADALRLPDSDRATLAARLLESLDDTLDPDCEAAWQDEVKRRLTAVQRGSVDLADWEKIKVQRGGDDSSSSPVSS